MKNMDPKLRYSEAHIEVLVSNMPDILTTSGKQPGWNNQNTDDDGWT